MTNGFFQIFWNRYMINIKDSKNIALSVGKRVIQVTGFGILAPVANQIFRTHVIRELLKERIMTIIQQPDAMLATHGAGSADTPPHQHWVFTTRGYEDING